MKRFALYVLFTVLGLTCVMWAAPIAIAIHERLNG